MDKRIVLHFLEQLRSHRYNSVYLEQHIKEYIQATHWACKKQDWSLAQEYALLLTSFFMYHRPVFEDGEDDEGVLEVVDFHWRRGYEVLKCGLIASKELNDSESIKQFLANLATLAANIGYLLVTSTKLGYTSSTKDSVYYFHFVEKYAAEYLAMVVESQERRMLGYHLMSRWGKQAMISGQHPTSQNLLNMALSIFEEENHKVGTGECYLFLGRNAEMQGQIPEARGHYLEAAKIGKQVEHWNLAANALLALAKLSEKEGNTKRARKLCREGLLLVSNPDDPVVVELRAFQNTLG